MKTRCFMIILLLGLSWLLSFQENHICSDSSSAGLTASAVETQILDSGNQSSSEDEHDKEMCHFGHCSHGIRVSFLQLSLPYDPDSFLLWFPYSSRPLQGILRSYLRPPALA